MNGQALWRSALTGLVACVPVWLRETRCVACGCPRRAEEATWPGLCAACTVAVRHCRVRTCATCGLPVGTPSEQGGPMAPGEAGAAGVLCGTCLGNAPPWTRFTMVNLYEGALRSLVLRAKFQRDAALLRTLGEALATVLAQAGLPERPEAVIPVPLHASRLRQRGYNQCLELAKPLVYRLGMALQPSWVERVVPTPFQRGLSREARRANVREAFGFSPEVRDRHVLVLDDIMTTGSTLRRIGAGLVAAGARQVDVAVVARTPRDL